MLDPLLLESLMMMSLSRVMDPNPVNIVYFPPVGVINIVIVTLPVSDNP